MTTEVHNGTLYLQCVPPSQWGRSIGVSSHDVGLRELRIYLLESGITVHALAKRLGVTGKHLSVELSRGPRHAMRRRIEWCLQYPFWSDPPIFHARSHIFLHTGHEPGQMSVRNILKLARRFGLRTRYRPRDELILLLHDHLHRTHRKRRAQFVEARALLLAATEPPARWPWHPEKKCDGTQASSRQSSS